jgi:hypothetical protein
MWFTNKCKPDQTYDTKCFLELTGKMETSSFAGEGYPFEESKECIRVTERAGDWQN